MASFIFGGNTGVSSPQELERRRQLAALMSRQALTSEPNTIGGGLAAIGDAIAARRMNTRLDKQEAAGRKSASDAFAPVLAALSGGSPTGRPDASVSTAPAAAASPAPDMSGNDVYSGFMDTVKGGVTNPYALASIAATGNAESKFSPGNANRTWNDGANNAGGIMSWNGPRLNNLMAFAKSKGESGLGSPQTQAEFFLHENPDLIAKLNSAKSVQEAQNIMNDAWRFKGYDQPGNPDATRRLSYAEAYLPKFQGNAGTAAIDAVSPMPQPGAGQEMAATAPGAPQGGTQTASIAPALPAQGGSLPTQQPAAMPAHPVTRTPIMALAAPDYGASVGSVYDVGQQLSTLPQQAAPPAAAAPVPAPSAPAPQQAGNPVMAALAQRFGNSQQLANADPRRGILTALLAQQGGAPAQGGGQFPAAPQAGGSGPTTQQLTSVLSNPWVSDGTKAVATALLKQRMAANDPSTQLDMQYKRAQIEHLLNPQSKTPSFGQSPIILTDPDGKMHMGQMSSGGGMLIDGKTYASLPEKWKVGTVSQSGSGGLSPETLDILSTQYLAGDKSAIQGFSRNANMRAQLANAIAKKADEMGMDGKSIAAEISAYGGNVAAQRSAGTRAAQVGMAASEANKMADVALEASQAVPRGAFVPWNKAVNAYRTGTSSPQMAAFVTATTSLVNAYARAISPLGAPTDAMRQHAEEMLNTAQSPQAYAAVINQMKKEMEAALNAPAEISDQLKKQVTGKKSEAQAPATPDASKNDPLGIR